MHIQLRIFGKPDSIVGVESKLTKIDQLRKKIRDMFDVEPKLQRLFYGGKLLENGYTFHDYNIKINDVIQLMIMQQPADNALKDTSTSIKSETTKNDKNDENNITYKDAESTLYTTGDLIDARDMEQGSWLEGKIVRIVEGPPAPLQNQNSSDLKNALTIKNGDSTPGRKKVYDCDDNPDSSSNTKENQNGNAKYFFTNPKSAKKMQTDKKSTHTEESVQNIDESLLFKVQLDSDESDSNLYYKLKDIRPRARKEIDVTNLKVGMKVMINHNTEEPLEKGYWYDFKIDEIKKLRKSYELVGTLYLGPEAVPQFDTKARIVDKIFAIEEVVPLAQRTKEYSQMMTTPPQKRASPLNCLTCRDDEEMLCKDCGCYECSGKESPESIVLCDECNHGYHMKCLSPPLTELPEGDWYGPCCRHDPNDVIAPGAAKQARKTNSSSRDWGRGMACVGKTKTCAMPANHFGPIPGIEVGMCWRFRIQLSESGVHRPPVAGIHGRDVDGAYSIVLSGGYEDDEDHGGEFTYTGSGGRDLSGNKRTAGQSCHQTLTRENRALARNCAVSKISEEGGDAGEDWRAGKPVRVVRSYKMLKHFPNYAPREGIRYDGIYKVVKYYQETGLSGYRVWKYLLRRDDPSPAPWEPEAKQFPIIYPDGYLEAQAQKLALKGKKPASKPGKRSAKRALIESDQSTASEGEASPPVKKQKLPAKAGRKSKTDATIKQETEKVIPKMFTVSKTPKKLEKPLEGELETEEKEAMEKDTLNAKLWEECAKVLASQGKKEFIESVTQQFMCIICQDVAVCPVTTPCLHNFCMSCIKLAFKQEGPRSCAACRRILTAFEPAPNEALRGALRLFLPGYDSRH